MRAERARSWRRARLPGQLALSLLAILLALNGYFSPARLWAAPVMAAAYFAAALACLAVPGKRRLLTGLCGAAAMVGLAALVCGGHIAGADLTCVVLCLLLLASTLPLMNKAAVREVTPVISLVGVAVYLVVYGTVELRMWAISADIRPLFDALLLIGFLAYMLLTLLVFGGATLETASVYGKVPVAMRKRINALVVALMLLVTLIAAIPVLKRWFEDALTWLVHQAARLIAWLASLMGGSGDPGGSGGGGSMDFSALGEAAEPSPFALLLEKVMMVFAGVIAVILLALLLRRIWQLLKKLVRLLLDLLMQYTSASSEDYIDEVSSTLDDAEHEDAALLRRHRRARRRVDERTLTPAALIRWRYQQLRSQHREWPDAATARETLTPAAAEVYERARYSDHEVTRADADKLLEK